MPYHIEMELFWHLIMEICVFDAVFEIWIIELEMYLVMDMKVFWRVADTNTEHE